MAELDSWRSLTRLLVGAALLGLEELQVQLREWEATARKPEPAQLDATMALLGPQPVDPAEVPVDVETPAEQLRYALLGMLFEAQAQLGQAVQSLQQLEREGQVLLAPVLEALEREPRLQAARARFAQYVARGEAEVDRWIAIGRVEEQRSRALAQTALRLTVDRSISQVAQNPEVLELVQTQGSGLANEVIEEVRERAVSADTLIERIARLLLRRTPREQLPEPPLEVKLRAAQVHQP